MPARHNGPTKICPKCKQDLPLSEFNTIKTRNNRPVPRCRMCAYETIKEWRKTAAGRSYTQLSGKRQRGSEKYKQRMIAKLHPRPLRQPLVIEGLGIAKIPLTRGHVAVIDLADLSLIAPYQWQARVDPDGKSGYEHIYAKATIRENGQSREILMHQFLAGEGVDVDHRDNDGLNNRRYNLRAATRSQNLGNQRKRMTPTSSKYKGVAFCKQTGKWRAQVVCQGKKYWLGRFREEFDAAQAYNLKAEELFGEFALLNEVAA